MSKVHRNSLRGTALLRLDFNTEDEWRMTATLRTVRFLLKTAEKIVMVSHRGRPASPQSGAGKPHGFERKLSLRRDAKNLGALLGRQVHFVPHFNFPKIKAMVSAAPRGSIFLLENIRFLKGERANERTLAARLASLADFYVNDAFAVSHRDDATVHAITTFLPSFAGLELEREIGFLSRVFVRPKKPIVIVLGGGKAIDKLDVLRFFKNKVDWFLLGGAPANTLLFLKGIPIGSSLADRDPADIKKLKSVLRYRNVCVPVDWVWKGGKILDIGPKTVAAYAKKSAAARTLVWSGPMGLFEKRPYDRGTRAVARAIVKNHKVFSLAGGGETVAFLRERGFHRKISFISTGGTAML
ncbi:MAG: phosphoglycerate kinase, partial [bacterium]|nr:phosphoglycerate kinase [bacterium]